MSRKNRDRNLATAFNTEESNEDVTSKSNNNTVTSDVIQQSNTDTSTTDVTEQSNNVTEDVSQEAQGTPKTSPEATGEGLSVPEGESKPNTVEDLVSDFMREQKQLEKKDKMEDTHTRSTFLIRKDLANRLEKLSAKEKRGFKTRFINRAIEVMLDASEPKKK